LRQDLLNQIQRMTAGQVMERAAEGLPKLWTIHHALKLRREHPEWFNAAAGYVPLGVTGKKSHHAIAFQRGEFVATVVPRWSQKLGSDWGDTAVELPAPRNKGEKWRWANRLTGRAVDGGRVAVADLLRDFPVALLTREEL
jgi:(1->4)-alpha-D-glucan 1-alpha-D-glucosylmutase